MTLWLLAGLLSAGVVLLLCVPFLKRNAGVPTANADLAVYRDQLAELEREVARGLLPEAEAAAARLEIQRRLLGAAAIDAGPASGAARSLLGAALLLLLPVAAVAIYLDLGSPNLPAVPFAPPAPAAAPSQAMAELVDRLKAGMKSHPEDPKGWTLLGDALGQLGRYGESAEAYGKAIAALQAKGMPVTAELHSLQGEALTAAAGGQVTPTARTAFDRALALDAKDPRARFYLALAESQAGHVETALDQWLALEADSPPGAPWLEVLRAQIDAAARQLGRDPASLPGRKAPPPGPAAAGAPSPSQTAPGPTAPGPTAEDMAAAAGMTPEQRAAFIDSMVGGLAAKLKDHPEDVDGWLRLADAYDKLGRPEDALQARQQAALHGPDRLDAQIAYAAAGALRAEQGQPPADFAATVERLRKLSPDNPLGLYCAGLIAAAAGDKVGAKALWEKLLPLMPEGSAQRRQLEARIAALGI
jgi:cytochrome c-type biogenesis protein CcmH